MRSLLFLFILLATFARNTAFAEEMRLAVTTSFHNSGLSDVLLPAIRRDTGVTVRLLVVGTGQALRLGKAGDVDAILVHSRAAEEAFVEAGHATRRREIMYNDFVIIGPSADPAKVSQSASAEDALMRIHAAQALFLSRGDDSGTHRRELSLWQMVGLSVSSGSGWYREAGAGMGAALNTASGLNAYILADRASWLNFANKADLRLLYSGDAALFNQYAYLPLNPRRHPHVKSSAAGKVETWLAGETGQAMIGSYRIKGQLLFTPNAKPVSDDGR